MAYLETIATYMGINILLALSVYVIFMTGQLSVGQGGFFAIGAYASGILTLLYGVPYIPALLLGGLLAGLAGLGVGIPALRLRGLYLAIATLGFGEMMKAFLLNFRFQKTIGGEVVGPAGGTGFRFIKPYTSLGWVAVFVVLAIVFFLLLSRSRLGYALDVIRQDEVAAASIGIPVTRLKVASFATGGFLAGLAGGLHSHFLTYIGPPDFGLLLSVSALAYAAIGGIQTFWGPVLGAVVLIGLPEMLRFLSEFRMMLYGLLLVLVMIVRPRGILDRALLARLGGLVRLRDSSAAAR